MPETAKPREPKEEPRPGPGERQGAPSAPSREQKRDEPVVWPRDLTRDHEGPASVPDSLRIHKLRRGTMPDKNVGVEARRDSSSSGPRA